MEQSGYLIFPKHYFGIIPRNFIGNFFRMYWDYLMGIFHQYSTNIYFPGGIIPAYKSPIIIAYLLSNNASFLRKKNVWEFVCCCAIFLTRNKLFRRIQFKSSNEILFESIRIYRMLETSKTLQPFTEFIPWCSFSSSSWEVWTLHPLFHWGKYPYRCKRYLSC